MSAKSEKTTVALIKGEGAIMKLATSLSKSAANYASRLHVCLCSALAHALEHGNVSVVENVYRTIDPSTDRPQIDAWIRGNSNLTYREVKGVKMYRKPEGKALIIRMDDLIAKPFWTWAPDGETAEPRLIDVEQRIVSFVRSLEKAIEAGLVKHEPKETKAGAVKRAKKQVDALADFVARTFHVSRAVMDPPPVAPTPPASRRSSGDGERQGATSH